MSLAALLACGACSRSDPPTAPPKVERRLPRRPAEPILAVRLPRRALVPQAPASVVAPERPDPCLDLVATACALYPEGAQECVELRSRVRRIARDRGRDRCAEALRRHAASELVPARATPCSALVAMRCAQLGEDTDGCGVLRRRLLRVRDEQRERSCLADLLVADGVGGDPG